MSSSRIAMETDKNNQSMDTAIESEDNNEGNTIADKLRANPDKLKAGPRPLGDAEVRRRKIERTTARETEKVHAGR